LTLVGQTVRLRPSRCVTLEEAMTAPNLGSLLIGSSNVDAMKDWYRQAFGPEENAMGAFVFGSFQYFIEEHSDVSGPATDPARYVINFDVEDCRALEAHLNGLGVRWVRPVEQMPFGLIGTVADPDGNYLNLVQWGATPDAGHGG
jgi:predicted enzyme related to lactoylglutathione lyase